MSRPRGRSGTGFPFAPFRALSRCAAILVLLALHRAALAFPVPVLSVHGTRNPLSIVEVVTLDASLSYDDATPNATLYFTFDFGDGFATPMSTVSTATHVYTTPGTRVVRVRANNRNATDGITAEGRPAPFASSAVAIVDRPSCYYFSVTGEESGAVVRDDADDGFVDIYAQVTIFAGSPPLTRTRLTREFADVGERPVATFTNSTRTIDFPFGESLDEAHHAWRARVDLSMLADSAEPFTLTVRGTGVSLLSCSIADSTFQWMPYVFKGQLGTTVSTGAPTPQGRDVRDGLFVPADLVFSTDPCTYSAATAVFGRGALMVLSNNIFGSSTRVVDLAEPLCAALGTGICSASFKPLVGTLDVISSAVVTCVDAVIILSNRGVFIASSLTTSGPAHVTAVTQNMPASFVAAFADGSLVNVTTARLFGPLRCEPGFPEKYVGYVVYTPANTAASAGIVSLVAKARTPFHEWSALSLSAAALGLDTSIAWRIIEVTRDNDLKNDVVLLTRSNGTRACVVVAGDGSSPALTFVFPPDQVFTGLRIHANGYNMYAFGEGMWLSSDGGGSFRKLAVFPDGDVATDLLTSTGHEAFAIVTSSGAVYYGRAGALTLVRARGPTDATAASKYLEAGVIDNQGDLFMFRLSVPPPGPYPASPSAYPLGLLDLPNGTVSRVPFRKTLLPTMSYVRADDAAFDAALAIAPLSFEREYAFPVGAVARRSNGANMEEFEGPDVGRWLVQVNAADDFGGPLFYNDGTRGAASVRAISTLTGRNVALCDRRTPFAAVTVQQSPARAYALTVVGPTYTELGSQPLHAYTSGARSYPGTGGSSEAVALVLSGVTPGAEGWLRSDVGKTVAIASGVYAITRFGNSTSVDALEVAPAPFLRAAFDPQEWAMYDFRAYFEHAAVSAQGVTVSGGGALAAVVLDAGHMIFTPSHVGMVLGETDGGNSGPGFSSALLRWGVVASFVNASAVLVDATDGGLQQGYLPAGRWTLYALAAGESLSHTPHVRARPWRLVVGECPYMELTTSKASRMLFIDYGESTVLGARLMRTLAHADASLANTAVGLYAGMTNPDMVGFRSNATLRGVGVRTMTMDLEVSDNRQQGSVSVSVRPPDASLTCDVTALDWRVVIGCPPDRRLEWVLPYNLTVAIVLSGNTERASGRKAIIDLPANYRPPSTQGRGVPIAPRFYNAHPELPRHYNDFKISRETGAFGVCSGKATRADCGCTEAWRLSNDIKYSDCQDRAVTARYLDKFHPVFHVLKEGVPPEVFTGSYKVVEVNGRTDWRFDSYVYTPGGDYTVTDRASIIFSGWQLYHFRISVVTTNTTYCNLETYIKVYVEDPPLTTTVMFISVSITGTLFAGLIFLGYLWHHRTHQNSF